MGNSQFPPSDPEFVAASRAFTPKELADLKSLFVSLAAQSHSNGRYISPSVFQDHFGLRGSLGDRMFDLVTRHRNDHKLRFEDLVIAKATYEKGTHDEIDEYIYKLLDINADGILGRSDVESALGIIIDTVFFSKSAEIGGNSRSDAARAFLDAASFARDDGQNGERMSFDSFRSWCSHIPSVRRLLGSLLIPPSSDRLGSQVPRLLYPANVDSSMLLLTEEYAWHIGGGLSPQELDEWTLLYHSLLNGLSFTTFLGNISNDSGPTLLIIKDKEGCVYGGYASQPWERHGDFYGDMKSFLFQLYPTASIFRPTGANNNLQWCAVNFSSDSIPNGIGFGGRVNHFGLFLSAGFDQGHAYPCTTFSSPCLAKTNKIYPEVIECWGVARGDQHKKLKAVKGTVLERFKEDRSMLNMVGIANASE